MKESPFLRLVGEALCLAEVDADRGFIALGGDSLAAITISRRLQRTCGIELDALDILTCSSLAELAEDLPDPANLDESLPPATSEKG